jgi:hypothetical protein
MTLAGSKFYKPLLVLLALALLGLASSSQQRLNRLRGDLGLTRVEPLENAPPILSLTTVALGGFRGLIANALWVRAMDLQEDDKYFEMVQLADWITKLQPHISTVWIVQAWNMSYNISIKFSEPADRWNWVSRGIELLRDEALKYNPHDVNIYRELAWHFQHKMGSFLDDAHLYYKSVWATQMQDLLGGGRPDFAALINPKTDAERARARVLREHYKMDPALMQEVDERYGPLEWRLPEASAIYWGYVGKKLARSKEDLIKLRRIIYQSMLQLFEHGHLIENQRNHTVTFSEDLNIIPKTNAAYEEMIADDPEQAPFIARAYKNFLLNAVYSLYVHNRRTQAEEWLKVVKQKFPQDYPPAMTLDEYAIKRVEEDVGDTSQDTTIKIVRGMLVRSYTALVDDRDEEAVGYDALARNIWRRYMGKMMGGPSEKRVPLPPLDDMRTEVVKEFLDPQSDLRLAPEPAAILRTKLPALAARAEALIKSNAAATGTNAPPVAPEAATAPATTNAPPAP